MTDENFIGEHSGGSDDKDEIPDKVPCQHCGGTGEVERPKCPWKNCNQKMMRSPTGSGWVCPFHQSVMI